MSDLISRQAAIDAIRDLESSDDFGFNDGLICSINRIAELPSIQSEREEGKWIPVTGGLPSYWEDVLLSIGGYATVGYLVPVSDAGKYNWFYSGWYHSLSDVDAWMPLPEPYDEPRKGEKR